MMEKNYILLTTVVGLLSWCFSCSMSTEAQKNTKTASDQTVQNTTQPSPSPDEPIAADEIDTSKWKTYKDGKNGYSFKYPPNLTLQKKGNKVRLYHFIDFKHQDPCDMRNEPPLLSKLIDFDTTFEVVSKNIDKAISDLPLSDHPQTASWKLGGKIGGKSVRQTIELCGNDAYIFPFKTTKSLIIKDEIISLFSGFEGTAEEAAKALQHPDIIKPAMSAVIIENILESFRAIEN